MSFLILVVDDESDVEDLFRQALLTKPIDFVAIRSEIDSRVGSVG